MSFFVFYGYFLSLGILNGIYMIKFEEKRRADQVVNLQLKIKEKIEEIYSFREV